ncbi:MAG: hypothetical protein ACOYT8_03870 [Candidatus Dependentiae bacterium]
MYKYVFLSLIIIFSCYSMEKNEQEHWLNNEFKLDKLFAELPPELTTEIITQAFPEAAYFGSVVMPVPVPQPEDQITQEAKEYWQELNETNIFKTKKFEEFYKTLPEQSAFRKYFESDPLLEYKVPHKVAGPNREGYFVAGYGLMCKFSYEQDKKIKLSDDDEKHMVVKAIHPLDAECFGFPDYEDAPADTYELANLKTKKFTNYTCTESPIYQIQYYVSHGNDQKKSWMVRSNKDIVLFKKNKKAIDEKTILTQEELLDFCLLHSSAAISEKDFEILDFQISLTNAQRILICVSTGKENNKPKKISVLCAFQEERLIPVLTFNEIVGFFDSILTHRCDKYLLKRSYPLAKKLLRFVPVNDCVAQVQNNYQQKINAAIKDQDYCLKSFALAQLRKIK